MKLVCLESRAYATAMPRYDDEIVELASHGLRPVDIARQLKISTAAVYNARKRAGLVTPARRAHVQVLPFAVDPEHQNQHAYTMFRAIERRESGIPITERTAELLEGFERSLKNRVWLYERGGDGFRAARRRPEHGDALVIEI